MSQKEAKRTQREIMARRLEQSRNDMLQRLLDAQGSAEALLYKDLQAPHRPSPPRPVNPNHHDQHVDMLQRLEKLEAQVKELKDAQVGQTPHGGTVRPPVGGQTWGNDDLHDGEWRI